MRPSPPKKVPNPRNIAVLKDRPPTSKEISSFSISKRSEKGNLDNPLLSFNFASLSHEKDPGSAEQRPANSTLKQNLQMKALKSLIKNKYGSIPQNFLNILRSLDKKDANSKESGANSRILDMLYRSPPGLNRKTQATNLTEKPSKTQKGSEVHKIVNKSYDGKSKFLDLDKQRNHLLSQRIVSDNSKISTNLNYVSDVRGNSEVLERNTNKKNLMPEKDLEEILDKFNLMERIGNTQGFLQSLRFIMSEIKARSPKTAVFLDRIESCYEKLINFLMERTAELSRQAELHRMRDFEPIKAKEICFQEVQTEPEFDWAQRIEQINQEKARLEAQNQRLILILKKLHNRGIDIERLFERQMESLLSPSLKISVPDIKKLKIDSEDSLGKTPKQSIEIGCLEGLAIKNGTANANEGNSNEQTKKIEKNNKMLSAFKLDLSKVNNLASNNGAVKENEEVVGFHQEFMARLNEFSESWRDAAMKERR